MSILDEIINATDKETSGGQKISNAKIRYAEQVRKAAQADLEDKRMKEELRSRGKLERGRISYARYATGVEQYGLRTQRIQIMGLFGQMLLPVIGTFLLLLLIWGPGVLAGLYLFSKIGWYFWLGLILVIYLWWKN